LPDAAAAGLLNGRMRMTATALQPLLEVEDLRVQFGGGAQPVRAVDGVSFAVGAGETVALVGESGCGKSVTALALARLVPPAGRITGGRVRLAGRDVFALGPAELHRLRGRELAYIFQEPGAALNPVLTVGAQLAEALRRRGAPRAAARAETVALLRRVGLPDPEQGQRRHPHELSGGQQQRVMIAMALAGRPRLLVADEPTTALDVTIQAQILDLLQDLQRELGMAVLLITHNLGLVAESARRVCVMYAGRVVESGPAAAVLAAPRHPYTRALLAAVPRLDQGAGRLAAIPGQVPPPGRRPAGCAFHPRCPCCRPACRTAEPPWQATSDGHGVCCFCWRSA